MVLVGQSFKNSNKFQPQSIGNIRNHNYSFYLRGAREGDAPICPHDHESRTDNHDDLEALGLAQLIQTTSDSLAA